MFGLTERSSPTFRRLLIGLVVFGVVVVLDLVLFGWLIFRSLSQREIERVLLETRAEAEDIAGRIEARARQGADLYTVIAVERETRTYIEDVMQQRGVVSDVTVYDKDGALVYKATGRGHGSRSRASRCCPRSRWRCRARATRCCPRGRPRSRARAG